MIPSGIIFDHVSPMDEIKIETLISHAKREKERLITETLIHGINHAELLQMYHWIVSGGNVILSLPVDVLTIIIQYACPDSGGRFVEFRTVCRLFNSILMRKYTHGLFTVYPNISICDHWIFHKYRDTGFGPRP